MYSTLPADPLIPNISYLICNVLYFHNYFMVLHNKYQTDYRICVCLAFYNNLTDYLFDDLEAVQRSALKIIFPPTTYDEALSRTGFRQELAERSFK